MPYRLGGDGSDGTIDCIHAVTAGLTDLGIPTPPIKPTWYDSGARVHLRALLQWGEQVTEPEDGDVIWVRAKQPTFGFVWHQGCICIIPPMDRVGWIDLKFLPNSRIYRYCPTSSS
jgi:hypothetical protein